MIKKIATKNILLILITSIMLGLLISDTRLAIKSVLDGINLWFYNVMPSLFPFMIFSHILFQLDTAYLLQKLFNKVMNKIFNISGSGILPLAMGYISGYPLGGKIVCDLRKENVVSVTESYKLLGLCSTTGPAFIIGIVALQMFDNMVVVPILLISNYLGAIINTLFLKNFYKEKLSTGVFKRSENKNFSIIINSAIVDSTQNILKIGGYMVFFNIFINYLEITGLIDLFANMFSRHLNFMQLSDQLINGILYGLFEITLGINIISKCSDPLFIKVAITSFIIAWSGLSIHMQTNSFLVETDIKYSGFLLGKISQSFISMGIALLSYKLIYPTSLSVYSNLEIMNSFENFNYSIFYYQTISILALITIFIFICRKIKKN
ncbi:hypothetical protein GC105_09610 [Alkalibaculum sp. M08DMB]|uniref:Sporulation integral membrane protein YlbJ n=1 Tax=Alkalibaculum sporogenes TaxID=2655001 RepID=A0A6A7K9H3_9FIRM|nr:hypothetical protein [Alkalibaculum sporogenes]MPW26046.1 hypothetical protein [Alkalibaculum sporogenes]